MRQASVAGWVTLLAASVSAVVLALMLYRGMAEPEAGVVLSLDTVGWAILVASLACLAVSIVLAFYVRFLRYAAAPSPQPQGDTTRAESAVEAGPAEDSSVPRDLSRLSEDERRLYDMIESAGGEILQMKLVSSGEFSKSKVTRLLDKLEGRGLIRRERRGMTNMVKLVR